MREKIHFAHGNGFPALCYQRLLNYLNLNAEGRYINKIGHNPNFPVTENWDFLVDELIESIKEKFDEPVVGVGHSLGGILTFLAAIQEPDLFKYVIMIDSPVIGRLKSMAVRLAKMVGLIDKLTPAARTLKRRTHWHNEQQLINYLRRRPLFKTFRKDCLEDYIHHGFINIEGYNLAFDRYIEYLIFRTLPHRLYQYEHQLKVPTALIYGSKSTVVKPMDIRYMEKYFQIKAFEIEGTHMLPFESPEAVGEKIFDILKSNPNHGCDE